MRFSKKIIVCFSMLFTSLSANALDSPDINADGQVNIRDVVVLINLIADNQNSGIDLDGDNLTTITDVKTLIDHVLNNTQVVGGTGAYQYVTAADVGVTIGVGAGNSAIPTAVYSGPTTINTPTTIENKVINGCLTIKAANVTIRNSIINCASWNAVKMDGGHANLTVEYSKVECTNHAQNSKVFNFAARLAPPLAPGGAPNGNISNNEIVGCEDFFYINGNLDGLVIENNYMHTVFPGGNNPHSDGIQIGEQVAAIGSVTIKGNYIDPDNASIDKTAAIFASAFSEVNLLIENNFFQPYGTHTIRCRNQTQCTIKNNVFAQSFDSKTDGYIVLDNTPQPLSFSCNRYLNGVLVERYAPKPPNNVPFDRLNGNPHVITNCPAFP